MTYTHRWGVLRYPIHRSLNLRMKSSCSDFARSRLSSWLQVLTCHSGLVCSGYLSSNVFIIILYFIFPYIIGMTTYSVCKLLLRRVKVTGEVLDRTGEVNGRAGHSSEVHGKDKRLKPKPWA